MRTIIGLMAILFALSPERTWAQAGWYLSPSVTLSEEYDDNITLSSANRQGDFITRLVEGQSAGYKSAPFTLLTTSAATVEAFATNPDRDGVNALQASLDITYLPTRPVTLRLGAAFIQTQTPSQILQGAGVGLEPARQSSRQITAAPSLLYSFDPRTSGELGYSYAESDAAGVTNTTHEPRLKVGYDLTRLDNASASYSHRLIQSDLQNVSQTFHSDLLLLGWTRRVSATTTLLLEAGPRISDGVLGPEVNARLSHRFQQGNITLAYARSETTIIGQSGLSTTQSFSAGLSVQALKSLSITFAPLLSEISSQTGDTMTQGFQAAVSYRMLKWLSTSVRYRFNRSVTRGSSVPGGSSMREGTIWHNVFTISLDAYYPSRIE